MQKHHTIWKKNRQNMSSEKQETAAVRVLGRWPSPFVIRVLIVLGLKGVDHELVEEAVGNKSELLLASNPVHKMIPVLLHHGRPISESLIIVQYVDEAWASHAPALLPSDPYARAAERFWAHYVDDKVKGLGNPVLIFALNFSVLSDKMIAYAVSPEQTCADCSMDT
uniref:Glutathione S-transferase n=1 Tax=Aegilops tauschii subsp. strangulata TaxID=200361 RepID=A0A452YP05_AEGTS